VLRRSCYASRRELPVLGRRPISMGATRPAPPARPPRVLHALLAAVALLPGVLVVACSSPATEEARVRVVAIGWEDGALELPWLEIRLDDGETARTVQGAELRSDATYAQPHSAWFSTPASGDLRVTVSIMPAGGPVVAEGTATLELRADWGWEVQVHVAPEDPATMCFGCAGSLRLGSTGGAAETVWLVWEGNRISEPVVY
jgi:hypothetical protein